MKSDNQIKDYPRDIDAELESMWYRFTACLDKISTHTRIQALEMKMDDAEKVLTSDHNDIGWLRRMIGNVLKKNSKV